MSELADKLIAEAKAYKSGGKKKIKAFRQQRHIAASTNVRDMWSLEDVTKKNSVGEDIFSHYKIIDPFGNEATLDELTELFKAFCGFKDEHGIEHRGEAFPPPINEKGKYLGVLQHELDGFKVAWVNLVNGVMFKWPRGFGKTYLATWFMEFTMLFFGFPWMYLSSTEILTDVSFWIYRWASSQKLITTLMKGSKKNTYKSFEMNNGAKMRIYEYMGEELVGQHGWYIAMDDIIKKKWEDRPSDGLKAKRQWLHSISYIRRKGLLIFGTRKYQGDPLEFLETILVDHGMVVEVRTPYIMDGVFPDWVPLVDPLTGRELLWVPELYTWEELESKKVTNEDPDIDPYLAWQSEMMQNPLPRSGGLAELEDLKFVEKVPSFRNTRCLGIGVDLAWTDGVTSDSSAVISCAMSSRIVKDVRYSRPQVKKAFTMLRASIGRFPIRNRYKDRDNKELDKFGVLETIQQHWDYLRKYFPGIPIIVAIERNNGGIVIIDQARRAKDEFVFANDIIEDSSPAYKKRKAKDPNITVRLGITHSKEKVARVFGELSFPIKSGELVFHMTLYNSDFIEQIITFPRGRFKDGPDAAGMVKDELNKRWGNFSGRMAKKVLAEFFKKQKMKRFREEWVKHNLEPWNQDPKQSGRR